MPPVYSGEDSWQAGRGQREYDLHKSMAAMNERGLFVLHIELPPRVWQDHAACMNYGLIRLHV